MVNASTGSIPDMTITALPQIPSEALANIPAIPTRFLNGPPSALRSDVQASAHDTPITAKSPFVHVFVTVYTLGSSNHNHNHNHKTLIIMSHEERSHHLLALAAKPLTCHFHKTNQLQSKPTPNSSLAIRCRYRPPDQTGILLFTILRFSSTRFHVHGKNL
ncbi:hypothetical protein E8E13_010491 [Curvularia kusanoi]|uniref:Uncharacterized protein n=1 Tax=Curvularia kusanoi TaxID=90978 RepID=A0A9P4TIM5_CURKU|nr:hypothetical protein E8E13_010491 [Curvularia kusanoi]